MKIVAWSLEPLRAMFETLATTDDIALTIRGLGWGSRELEAIRMFAQAGGTAEDLEELTRMAGVTSKYQWRDYELDSRKHPPASEDAEGAA